MTSTQHGEIRVMTALRIEEGMNLVRASKGTQPTTPAEASA